MTLPVKESSDELNPTVLVSPEAVPAPKSTRTTLDYAALAIATFGVGYLPLIPGTFGSMVGVGDFPVAAPLAASSFLYCGNHTAWDLGRVPD